MRTAARSITVLLIFAAISLYGGDEKSKQKQADEKAAMEAMIKAGTPGDPHKMLATMEGTFDATVRMWSAPGTEPAVSPGVSWNKTILGGRWLEQRFESSFMGQKFEGIGYTGYDNIRKQYVGSWMDTMSTGMMLSTGRAGKTPDTYDFEGTMDDPMTGKAMAFQEIVTITDTDHHTFEMFGPGPDGKTFKTMEIVYVRRK